MHRRLHLLNGPTMPASVPPVREVQARSADLELEREQLAEEVGQRGTGSRRTMSKQFYLWVALPLAGVLAAGVVAALLRGGERRRRLRGPWRPR
jgi:hypothetical protein